MRTERKFNIDQHS